MARRLRTAWIVLTAAAVVVWSGGAGVAGLPAGSRAPAFIGGAEDWINSPPLTWKQLEGKVVLVDFWEYTCVNCIRTYPYLQAWHERYAPYGLVIVGIHTPEFGFSALKRNVTAATRRDGIKYPVLDDARSKNWEAYNESYWPSKYLFDQRGRLVLQHAGEGEYQQTELKIQELLRRKHPEARFPAPLPPQRPGDRPGAACRPDTPELYTNPTYSYLANLPPGWRLDEGATFRDPGRHEEGSVYAHGRFVTRYQSLQHARSTARLEDYVAIRYRGTEVNVVVNRPQERDYKVYVTLDGRPLPADERGDDVKLDARGTYFAVTAPRMYNIIRGAYGVHDLKLACDSPDFDIYSFTFSGCPQR